MCFACGILCNLYRYGTACEISVIYVFSITIQFKCFFRNCPSNFLNVPLNFDEWDRMTNESIRVLVESIMVVTQA